MRLLLVLRFKAEKAKAAASFALSRESKTESQEVRQEIKANFKGDILEILNLPTIVKN